MVMSVEDIETALCQYIGTALWSELDDEGEPLDATFDVDDISFGSRVNMADDLKAFIAGCEEHRPNVFTGVDPGQVGHDFWLTRNGHGAGFWDRGLGEVGDWLTSMAKPYGEAHLWTGEDGRVYYQS